MADHLRMGFYVMLRNPSVSFRTSIGCYFHSYCCCYCFAVVVVHGFAVVHDAAVARHVAVARLLFLLGCCSVNQ